MSKVRPKEKNNFTNWGSIIFVLFGLYYLISVIAVKLIPLFCDRCCQTFFEVAESFEK